MHQKAVAAVCDLRHPMLLLTSTVIDRRYNSNVRLRLYSLLLLLSFTFPSELAYSQASESFEIHRIVEKGAPDSIATALKRGDREEILYIDAKPLLAQSAIDLATVGYRENGAPEIVIRLTKSGGQRFGAVLSQNL